MKWVILLIIMVLYLFLVFGIMVFVYYCSGKFVDVFLFGFKLKMICVCGVNSVKGKVSLKKKCCE